MVSGGLVKGAAKGGDVAVKGGGVCNGGPPDEGAIAKQPYGRGGGGEGGGVRAAVRARRRRGRRCGRRHTRGTRTRGWHRPASALVTR